MLGLFSKNREQIKDLEQIKKFLRSHLDEFKSKEKSIPDDVFDATVFLLEEILDMYESITTLYKKDHFRSCIVLARSILENSINLRYIYQKDTEKRAKNFKLFSLREYLKRADKVENMPADAKEFLDFLKEQTENYQPAGTNQSYWDGKTIRDKSLELKSETIYDMYRHLSNYLHSKYQGNRNLSVERPYNDFLRKLVFKDILVHTLQALVAICERFDLDGGIMILHDYPQHGHVLFFATNPKRREAEMEDIKL